MKRLILIGILAVSVYVIISIVGSKKDGIPTVPSTNAATTSGDQNIFTDIEANSFPLRGEKVLAPTKFRTLTINTVELLRLINTAPQEKDVKAKYSNVILSLPLPNGTMGKFSIVESPVMEPGLAAQYPSIKTYLGQGIDDPYATVRFDHTQYGFHAMILSPNGTVFIDPVTLQDAEHYLCYYKDDYQSAVDKKFVCQTEEDQNPPVYNFSRTSTGEQLRTYRLAIGTCAEVTSHFGSVAATLAAMTTSVNRISGVYETDFAVRLVLVANETSMIYTNAATDPYTDPSNGSALLGQNQTACDNVIGTANYDIGHVFSLSDAFGGIAGLRVVCVTGQKGRGATGSSNPVGDPWDIDYVAHEMGHQFGGNHTQNNTSCNANASTAWEPGSGITIMGYAGVCAPNLSNHSIPYFHGGNIFNEIIPYTQTGNGSTCPVSTSTGNNPPVVTVPTGGMTIPISTPFSLTGSATDPNSDALTYSWEEKDTGPQGNPANPTGNAPLFRPFSPVTTGTRIFPKIADIINNTQVLGELLPTYSRSLNFRLTVRDNRAGGGGIAYADMTTINVTSTAGPFLVTAPNTAVSWPANSTQTVTWNVANTSGVPVSCTNVNILLSTDGGLTFPITVLANTPNDGSQSVTIPNNQGTTCRMKVEAVGNIFFDMSNTNFTITNPVGIENQQSGTPTVFELAQNYPNPFNPSTLIRYSIPYNSHVTLNIYDLKGELVRTLVNNEYKTTGTYGIELDASSLASGVYYYSIKTDKNTDTKKMILIK